MFTWEFLEAFIFMIAPIIIGYGYIQYQKEIEKLEKRKLYLFNFKYERKGE